MTTQGPISVAATDWRRRGLPEAEDFVALLWPVLLFDVVVAEDTTDTRLNLFQQAVLELCSVGVRDAVEMSARLHLDQGLVAVVLRELMDQGLVDADFRVRTDDDRASDLDAQLDWRVSTAVLDMWSGRLMPVLLERLETPSITWKGSDAFLELRNTNGPVTAVDPPTDGRLRAPTAKDVQEAAARADVRRHTVVGQRDTGQSDGPPLRVQSLAETGTPAVMPVVFYLPKAPEDSWGLSALGVDGVTDLRLLTSLDRASSTDAAARSARNRLDSTERKRQLGRYRDYYDGVRADADREVERNLDSTWRRDPSIWTAATNLAAVLREFDLDPDRGPAFARTAAIEGGLLLEAIGIRMKRCRPLHETLTRQLDAALPDALSAQVGAADDTWAAGRFPHQLLCNSLAPNSNWWNWAIAVAAANTHTDHPLRALLGAQPDWLLRMVSVTQLRNDAAHPRKDPIEVSRAVEVAQDAWSLAVAALTRLEPGEDA